LIVCKSVFEVLEDEPAMPAGTTAKVAMSATAAAIARQFLFGTAYPLYSGWVRATRDGQEPVGRRLSRGAVLVFTINGLYKARAAWSTRGDC
jgi:hypothetical protein